MQILLPSLGFSTLIVDRLCALLFVLVLVALTDFVYQSRSFVGYCSTVTLFRKQQYRTYPPLQYTILACLGIL